MKMTMSQTAIDWYKNELELKSGDHIRFHIRYGGCSTVQKGFSLGIVQESPDQPAASVEQDGLIFFVEEKDEWYFDGHDLHITMDEELNEPKFGYE